MENDDDDDFEINEELNKEEDLTKIMSREPLTFDDSLILLRQSNRMINKLYPNLRQIHITLSHAVKSCIVSHKRKNKKNKKQFMSKIK